MLIPFAKIEDILKIIEKAPSKNSTGFDDINMNIIKKVKHLVAPMITHLTNCIILTSTFPPHQNLTQAL